MNLAYPAFFPQQFFDGNGNPLSFGKVYTYLDGTTTHEQSFNHAGSANTWPVILDDEGRCQYRLDDSKVYEIVTTNSLDADSISYPHVSFSGGSGSPVDLTAYVKKNGTTPFTQPQTGIDAVTDEQLATLGQVKDEVANTPLYVKKDGSTPFIAAQEGVDADLVTQLTTLGQVNSAIATESSTLVKKNGITPFTAPQTGVDALTAQQLTTLSQVQSEIANNSAAFVKKDGTTPFTAPQTGVTATAATHLATLGQVESITENKQDMFVGICQKQFLTPADVIIDISGATGTVTIATVKGGETISASNPIRYFTDGSGISLPHESAVAVSDTFTYPVGTGQIFYVYFDANSDFIVSGLGWSDLSTVAPVMRFYFDATETGNARLTIEAVEYHKNVSSWEDHLWKHSQGAIWCSGLDIIANPVSINASGVPTSAPLANGKNTCIGLTSGRYMDDTLVFDVVNSTYNAFFNQDLGVIDPANLTSLTSGVFSGTYNNYTGILKKTVATRFPFAWNSSTNIPQYISDQPYPMPDNSWMVNFMYAFQDPRYGEVVKYRSAPRSFGTYADALAYAWEELQSASPTLKDREIRSLYKYIHYVNHTGGAYDPACKYAALVNTTDIRTLKSSSVPSASGSIPASSVTVVPTTAMPQTNAQSALEGCVHQVGDEVISGVKKFNDFSLRRTYGKTHAWQAYAGSERTLKIASITSDDAVGGLWGNTARTSLRIVFRGTAPLESYLFEYETTSGGTWALLRNALNKGAVNQKVTVGYIKTTATNTDVYLLNTGSADVYTYANVSVEYTDQCSVDLTQPTTWVAGTFTGVRPTVILDNYRFDSTVLSLADGILNMNVTTGVSTFVNPNTGTILDLKTAGVSKFTVSDTAITASVPIKSQTMQIRTWFNNSLFAQACHNDRASDANSYGFMQLNSGSCYIGGPSVDFAVGGATKLGITSTAVTVSDGVSGSIQTAWVVRSDARHKLDIKDSVLGLEFILGLRPVQYRMKRGIVDLKVIGVEEDHLEMVETEDGEFVEMLVQGKEIFEEIVTEGKRAHYGFIAQEVEELLAGRDFAGFIRENNEEGSLALRYDEFIAPMVKAMQEQKKMIEAQEKLINALADRVAKLEAK